MPSTPLVNIADGSSEPMFSGNPCTDGLAYDGKDDTIWLSPDVSDTVYHYQTDGTLNASFQVDIPNGYIHVAVLSTPDFDATSIDAGTWSGT